MNNYRLDPEFLVEIGFIPRVPPNNAPHWMYARGDNCDHVLELPINERYLWCPLCSSDGLRSQLRKVLTVPAYHADMPAHFNNALGSYVRNKADLASQYSQLSDETSARLNMDQRFEPIDLRDSPRTSARVDDTGLEDTYRRRRNTARDSEEADAARRAEREATRWL